VKGTPRGNYDFLAQAWQAANDKARELVDLILIIVLCRIRVALNAMLSAKPLASHMSGEPLEDISVPLSEIYRFYSGISKR
jgi:hypothetical protein